ncbi:MAG TPA: (deoxy)nucleoside triphosphate pyrophosphohydrolase [Mucilaginibacter sp.]|jgi:8-oxo-dGTP diphosphatase|nr:(deoxy)nucleoside triphosphate pyrophosphohydrolase [Mucilaginibacter sp.]
MIEVTCALILDSQNRIFAAQRSSKMSLPLKWEFPGGKVEYGETFENCLVREIKEELNVEIEILKRLDFNIHNYPSITIKLIPFVCRIIRGQIKLKEHTKYEWLNRANLLDLDWADADIPILNNYLRSLH